jgi:hypothetical protein
MIDKNTQMKLICTITDIYYQRYQAADRATWKDGLPPEFDENHVVDPALKEAEEQAWNLLQKWQEKVPAFPLREWLEAYPKAELVMDGCLRYGGDGHLYDSETGRRMLRLVPMEPIMPALSGPSKISEEVPT